MRNLIRKALSIRPFAPDDLPRLQEIRQAAFAPVFASFRTIVGDEIYRHALSTADQDQAVHLNDLCQPESEAVVLVAEIDGTVVGFVSYMINAETAFGEIGLNAVHPDHAGQGTGTHLYQTVLDAMKTNGVKAVEVATGGDPSHAAARRAYEKAGFGKSLPSVALYRTL